MSRIANEIGHVIHLGICVNSLSLVGQYLRHNVVDNTGADGGLCMWYYLANIHQAHGGGATNQNGKENCK